MHQRRRSPRSPRRRSACSPLVQRGRSVPPDGRPDHQQRSAPTPPRRPAPAPAPARPGPPHRRRRTRRPPNMIRTNVVVKISATASSDDAKTIHTTASTPRSCHADARRGPITRRRSVGSATRCRPGAHVAERRPRSPIGGHRAAAARDRPPSTTSSPGPRPTAGPRRWSPGVVRDGALRARRPPAGERPAPGRRPAVPDRARSRKTMTAALVLAAARRGPAGPRRPARPAPARHRRRRASPCASCSATPAACSASRTATGGSAPPASTSTRLLAGLTADKVAYPPHRRLPLLQPGVRAARRGARAAHRRGPGPTLLAKRLLDPLGMRRTTYAADRAVRPRLRRAPVARHAARGAAHRRRRDGAGRAALVDGRGPGPVGRVPGRPRPGGAGRRRPRPRCARPVVISDLDSWTGGHGLGLELWRRGERVYVGHSGSMPGYLAVLAVHRPTRTGGGRLRQRVQLRYPAAISGARPATCSTAVLDAEPAPVAPGGRPRPPPAPSCAELTGRWWWMGSETRSRWAGAGELVVTPLTTGRRAVAVHPGRADRGPLAGPLRRERRRDAARSCATATGAAVALDIATFVFTRDPWPTPDAHRAAVQAPSCGRRRRSAGGGQMSSAGFRDEVDQAFHRVDQRGLDVAEAVDPETRIRRHMSAGSATPSAAQTPSFHGRPGGTTGHARMPSRRRLDRLPDVDVRDAR